MKITTSVEPAPKFTPCSVTLAFESQAELEAIGSLFNYSPIVDAIRTVFETEAFEHLNQTFAELGAKQSIMALDTFLCKRLRQGKF